VRLYTAHVAYSGPDRFDVTRKTGGILGAPFSPSVELLRRFHPKWGGEPITDISFARFRREYIEEMRAFYRRHRASWAALLACRERTLVCYCTDGSRCHRRVLAVDVLSKIGAVYEGER
jgi:uncharacterized protein YeaO (DUF488 family)